ncbi:unnamed protein product [Amoebophrya sp. A120]|nr:unnamed protein product [Amoebophrya sp. A120]|eukprot:GSA120T00022935001.1
MKFTFAQRQIKISVLEAFRSSFRFEFTNLFSAASYITEEKPKCKIYKQNGYLQLTTGQVKKQPEATASRVVIMLLHINLFTKFWKIVSSFSVLTHQFSMLSCHNFRLCLQKLTSVLNIHSVFVFTFSRNTPFSTSVPPPYLLFLLQPVFVCALGC